MAVECLADDHLIVISVAGERVFEQRQNLDARSRDSQI